MRCGASGGSRDDKPIILKSGPGDVGASGGVLLLVEHEDVRTGGGCGSISIGASISFCGRDWLRDRSDVYRAV